MTLPDTKRPVKKSGSRLSNNRSGSRKSRNVPHRQRAKRLPAQERRGLIMKEAAVFFSEHGFAASTRDLADRLGVRQALLYKYFESKEALIDTVFDEAFDDSWTAQWSQTLADEGKPLAMRLAAFYSGYSENTESLVTGGLRLRLFLRGALDGYPLPARINPILTKALVVPVVADLRRQEGLPDLGKVPMLAGERELVMLLHGAMIFHHIRAHIYKAPVVDFATVSPFLIDTYLHGARASLKYLHSDKGPASLRATD